MEKFLHITLVENLLRNLVCYVSASLFAEEARAHEDTSAINIKDFLATKLVFDPYVACEIMKGCILHRPVWKCNVYSFGCTS